MPFDLPPEALLFAAVVCIFAGVVKGVIGIGLPLIVVPMMSGTIGPIRAMTLMAVSVIGVNVWQTLQSGYAAGAARRFWVAFPVLIAGILIGVYYLTRMPTDRLTILVGVLVVLISVSQIFPVNFTISERNERWLTPVIGAASGLLGGLTSFVGPIMATYLVALRLTKDQFVGAIALFYVVASIPFFSALAVKGRLGLEELIASCLATVAILVGVVIGQRFRRRAPPELFRRAVLIMIALIGLNMVRKGLA
ncbi:MAG: sulfite exporter TauE/SafE family protein [Alphaproteobacteria bacterium]|nr:sulfite exporter TauE/SafE family protein [Alphaproteobacteria bacterium]